ncbi:cache domain-containing protein [Candidatus Gracilibacteria bacterium]|nr:cache domain-containing protein [Candidatus Gracilibacteria bacterium]
MLLDFLFNTANFIIHVLASFASFLIGWLFLDVWFSDKKNKTNLAKGAGFFLIALFLLFSEIGDLIGGYYNLVEQVLIIGLILVFVGFIMESTPLLAELDANIKASSRAKNTKEVNIFKKILSVFLIIAIAGNFAINFLKPDLYLNKFVILGLIIFNLLLLASKLFLGIQKQLKNLFYGMFFFGISYGFTVIGEYLLGTDIRFTIWTQTYGIIWWATKIALFIGFFIIGRYAFYYLKYRLRAKFFISFIVSSLIVFFVVTIAFLLVLTNDFQKNTLNNLKASNKAIHLSLVDIRNRSILAAKALVNNESVTSGASTENHDLMKSPVEDILLSGNVDYIIITNEAALSIYETNDKEAFGRSYSNDKYIKRALEGIPTNTFLVEKGILSPQVVVKTYLPIVRNEGVLGVVIVANIIDNQFLDGIKKQTGLDSSIYADNTVIATTFSTNDGKMRLSGTKENDTDLLNTVLKKGEDYSGSIEIFNQEYLGIYTPLKDGDQKIIGMVFVGEPSAIISAVTRLSMERTFGLASILILLALIPIYFFSKNIAQEELV